MRLTTTLVMAALCFSLTPLAASAQDALFCGAVNGVLAAQANHFKNLRGDKTDKDTWDALLKLDHATSCDVEKDESTMYYYCEFDLASDSGDIDADTAQVKSLATAYAQTIAACRPEWRTEPGDRQVMIKNGAGDLVLSVDYYSGYFSVMLNDE